MNFDENACRSQNDKQGMQMKKKDIPHIRSFSAKVGGLCQRLYHIDRKIIDGGNNKCSESLDLLLKLKSDVIKICVWKGISGRIFPKQIESEIAELLWSINIRIDILKDMNLEGKKNRCFLEMFWNMYSFRITAILMCKKICDVIGYIMQLLCISEIVVFIISGVIGIFTTLLLQQLNIIVDANDSKYVILLTYIYFILGKLKKISLKGIRFWKPKNWKENVRK